MMLGAAHFWYWWAFGGLLMIVEAFVPGFMFLWLGVAAGLVGLVLVVWPAPSFAIQLLMFSGLSILSVTAWRWFQVARPPATDHPNLNRRGAQYIGRRFSLVAPIVNGRGRIELGDSIWAVEGPDMPAGQVVEVTGIEGIVLQVRPAPREHDAADAQAEPPARARQA
jgi:inner membrane protein